MSSGKFKWGLYARYVKPLPVPNRKELVKIKASLCMDADHPFPRCAGKAKHTIRKFEEKGDFSHSGNRRKHICPICRCKRVAGWGTKHYGVGYCYYHDVDRGRRVSKTQAIAMQQGYPLDPIKYKSDNEYIDAVRQQAEEAHGRLDLAEELVLLRAHLQEIELMFKKTGPKAMTMKGGKDKILKMTDDVKIDRLVKLVKAIGDLSRNSYVITESDYCHIDEIKQWIWSIYRLVEDKCKKAVTGEIKSEDLLVAFQAGLKEIMLPKTGRKNK